MQQAPPWSDVTGTGSSGERGATLVEYALLLALLVIVCFGALQVLGGSVRDSYETAGETAFSGPPPSSPGPPGPPPPTPGASCASETCTFGVTNPPAGATYSWTTSPNIASGSGPNFSYSSNSGPDYVVTLVLQPGNTTRTWSVTCTGNGVNRTCTVA
ncbi:MAG: hypothetical protein ABWZ76_05035 [Acidimicrobiales bacterium]